MIKSATILALASMIVASPAWAERASPAQEGRYALIEKADHVIRLDTVTGGMSLCRVKEEELICRLSKDDRALYEVRVELLQNQLQEAQADKTSVAILEGIPEAIDEPYQASEAETSSVSESGTMGLVSYVLHATADAAVALRQDLKLRLQELTEQSEE